MWIKNFAAAHFDDVDRFTDMFTSILRYINNLKQLLQINFENDWMYFGQKESIPYNSS